MSLNEALTEGILVTVVGLAIVFAVLIILMFALMIMKNIFYSPEQSAKKEDTAAAVKVPVKEVHKPEKAADDTEIIAVITAAVAAVLNTSSKQLKIKSYKRIGNNTPAWNKAGVSEMINSRF